MRVTGIILICIIPAITGFTMAFKAAKAQQQTELIIQLLQEMNSLITYQSMTLDDILSSIFTQPRYALLGFCKWQRQSGEFCIRVVQYINENDELKIAKEAKADLAAFLSALGGADMDGQQKLCELYLTRFRAYSKEQAENLPKKRKLCCSLGILTALFAAILLI